MSCSRTHCSASGEASFVKELQLLMYCDVKATMLPLLWERIGSVVECLTRDQAAAN